MAFFNIFYYYYWFRYFRDVKKENKTRSGFSVLIWAVLDRKTQNNNQIDIYLTSIVIGQKSTNQISQYMVWHGLAFVRCYRHWEHLEGLRVICGEYSDIVKNDILTMQLRFLDVSRFFYSAGWQVCIDKCRDKFSFVALFWTIHAQPLPPPHIQLWPRIFSKSKIFWSPGSKS